MLSTNKKKGSMINWETEIRRLKYGLWEKMINVLKIYQNKKYEKFEGLF